MKHTTLTLALMLAGTMLLAACGNKKNQTQQPMQDTAKVYYTSQITPEALVKIYKALGREAQGRVAIKISTGEGGNNHYLKPELIGQLVNEVNGTIVECNTAYEGTRDTFEKHWQTIRDHGFLPAFKVDLMDEEGDMRIAVADSTHIKCDIVGRHLANYDFMINLSHFKGHAMGGYGGALKNASIGVASANGKANIHTAGYSEVYDADTWNHIEDQDGFLESMAAAAQAVHNYFGNGERILYIAVMNNMSVDCDCDGNPAAPALKDYGIMASLDPVALDKACTDVIFNMQPTEGNDNQPLIERIKQQHGLHTIEYAAKIGLGTLNYEVVNLD